jgi:hypothetical protein
MRTLANAGSGGNRKVIGCARVPQKTLDTTFPIARGASTSMPGMASPSDCTALQCFVNSQTGAEGYRVAIARLAPSRVSPPGAVRPRRRSDNREHHPAVPRPQSARGQNVLHRSNIASAGGTRGLLPADGRTRSGPSPSRWNHGVTIGCGGWLPSAPFRGCVPLCAPARCAQGAVRPFRNRVPRRARVRFRDHRCLSSQRRLPVHEDRERDVACCA